MSEENDLNQKGTPEENNSESSQSESVKPTDHQVPDAYDEVISEPTEEDSKITEEMALAYFMEHPKEITERLQKIKNAKLPGDKAEIQKYVAAIEQAYMHHPSAALNVSPFNEKEDAVWRQALYHSGEAIRANKPRYDFSKSRLSGDSASIRVRAAMGLGTIVNVPLWHTGLWLKIKTPSDATLLETERRIAQDKIELGRATNGVAFSNTSVYLINNLTTMILGQVYGGTYSDLSVNALKKVIKINDIPQLIWGAALAIYPQGFKLVQPCVHDPMECNHINSAHVNLSRLSWVDNRALNSYQRNVMVDRDGQVTDEILKEYNRNHTAPQSKWVNLSELISIKLEVPTLDEYEKSGFEWVEDIINMTDAAFDRSLRGDERNEYITQQATLTSLRRYAHWIKVIRFNDDDSVIDTPESINEALNDMSSDSKTRGAIIETVEAFIRESLVSAIGIPKYDCPSCGKEPDPETLSPRLQEIIQLEVVETFFTLASTKVSLAMDVR